MIEIENLHVRIDDTPILKGVDLTINGGEVHAIMGPNGSGKSTLAQVIAGNESYEVTEGSIRYQGEDLLDLDADERAGEGVFMAFQYPVSIPGVSNSYFLREAKNSIREYRGETPMDPVEFIQFIKPKMAPLGITQEMLKRAVNEGFSGGEKKRNEIFQLSVLEPRLAVLDETDSGLDIDALRLVADGVNAMRSDDRAFLIVTHYQRLLDYIEPDFVHVIVDGRIVRSGDKDLAVELEDKGYSWVEDLAASPTPA